FFWAYLAGLFTAATVFTYLQLVILLPTLAGLYYALLRQTQRRLFSARTAQTIFFMVLGALSLTAALACAWHSLTGDWTFFRKSLEYASRYDHKEASSWLQKGRSWIVAAPWLYVPITVSLGCAAQLLVWAVRGAGTHTRLARFFVLNAF